MAHRLSTIKNADKIFVFSNGKIVEIGTHTDLMDRNGVYHDLVINQVTMGGEPGISKYLLVQIISEFLLF